jgi:hypothetical protein
MYRDFRADYMASYGFGEGIGELNLGNRLMDVELERFGTCWVEEVGGS